jgi:DNA polymerase III subunit delta'
MKQSLHPWFEQAWSELNLTNMPHAILLHGQTGIGKMDFALHLAKALICETTQTHKPCCQCEACHWFDTGNHPDFLGIVPENQAHLLPHEEMAGDDGLEDKPKKGRKKVEDDPDKADKKLSAVIKVEQIREALDGVTTSPHRGIQRVVLINPVETLNPISANTLLKTLEEPPESTLFILVSDRLDRIMPTIRSRCRLLAMGRPTAEVSMAWLTTEVAAAGVKANQAEIEKVLSEAGGAVMDARDRLLGLSGAGESAQEIAEPLLKALGEGHQINWLQTAEAIHKAPMSELLVTLERWTADLMSQQNAGQIRYYPSRRASLEACSKNARSNKLSDYWKVLLNARRHELHALANRVQIEALLIRYQEIFKD